MSSSDACVVTSDNVSKATMTSQAPNEQSWHDLWLSMSQPRHHKDCFVKSNQHARKSFSREGQRTNTDRCH